MHVARLREVLPKAVQFLSQNKFRILAAALIAYLILVSFSILEAAQQQGGQICRSGIALTTCVIERIAAPFKLDNLDKLNLLLLAVLYMLESGDRKRKSYSEAWQILDNAASAQVETSNARIQALQDLNQDRVSLKNIELCRADLTEINLFRADLRETDLRGVILKSANLREAKLAGANLSPFPFRDHNNRPAEKISDLSDADLTGANLTGTDLRGANLTNAKLELVCFKDVELDQATQISDKWRLVWAINNPRRRSHQQRRGDLRQQDFSNADLSNAELIGFNLSDTNLSGANLSSANLRQAKLSNANLQGANLSGANLTQTRMNGANLIGVKGLEQANLSNADLTGAIYPQRVFRERYVISKKSPVETGIQRRLKLGQSLYTFRAGAAQEPGKFQTILTEWWAKNRKLNPPEHQSDGAIRELRRQIRRRT